VLLVGQIFGVPVPRYDPTPPAVTAPAAGTGPPGPPGTIPPDGGGAPTATGTVGADALVGWTVRPVTASRGATRDELQAIEAWVTERQAQWLMLLEELVRLESPSDDPQAVGRCADRAAVAFYDWAGCADRPGPDLTPPCRRLQSGRAGGVLLLGHLDTVWDRGSFSPLFERAGDRIVGPGVFDMKGGVVVACAALAALRALGCAEGGATVLLTGDEEVGSHRSRDLIEAAARAHQAVLVLEPPVGQAVKTARKAVGQFSVTVTGRAAHAGIEPERGVNAIVELAAQIPQIASLGDPDVGTTVTVGVVRGGTRANVVPARASADVDMRVRTVREAERVEAGLRALRPVHPEARLEVSGELNRPPLPPRATADLFSRAREVAASLGWTSLEGAEVGGGSDGNFTAALGVPTLDGLGLVGGNAHAAGEWVVPSELPRRAALLAGVVLGCWRVAPEPVGAGDA